MKATSTPQVYVAYIQEPFQKPKEILRPYERVVGREGEGFWYGLSLLTRKTNWGPLKILQNFSCNLTLRNPLDYRVSIVAPFINLVWFIDKVLNI